MDGLGSSNLLEDRFGLDGLVFEGIADGMSFKDLDTAINKINILLSSSSLSIASSRLDVASLLTVTTGGVTGDTPLDVRDLDLARLERIISLSIGALILAIELKIDLT